MQDLTFRFLLLLHVMMAVVMMMDIECYKLKPMVNITKEMCLYLCAFRPTFPGAPLYEETKKFFVLLSCHHKSWICTVTKTLHHFNIPSLKLLCLDVWQLVSVHITLQLVNCKYHMILLVYVNSVCPFVITHLVRCVLVRPSVGNCNLKQQT